MSLITSPCLESYSQNANSFIQITESTIFFKSLAISKRTTNIENTSSIQSSSSTCSQTSWGPSSCRIRRRRWRTGGCTASSCALGPSASSSYPASRPSGSGPSPSPHAPTIRGLFLPDGRRIGEDVSKNPILDREIRSDNPRSGLTHGCWFLTGF